ncbi:MAG: VCBS repeat-containing protein [Armatimonadetes bacterium]|nr:VCBS repeat-containing protein [Armatimonadota bacterium]
MSRIGLWFLAVLLVVSAGPRACSQSDFHPPAIYPLPQEAKTVVVGDLNGDGLDDVAVTAWPSGLFVLCQQPDGLLGPPTQLYAPTMPTGLAIGDLDNDSRMDLAVGGANGAILLYYQATDGTLGLSKVCSGYGLVNSLVIDDLNGDGRADVADTSASFPLVMVSPQALDGTFNLPIFCSLTGSNARCISTLDANSDGIRDIALLLDNQACYLSGASGGFDAPIYIPAQWAYALTAGDVTGDGRDDLAFTVATNQPYASIGVIPQDVGGLGTPTLYPAYDFAQALAVADLDGDGRGDVVAAHGGYEAATTLYQQPDGTLGDWTSYGAPYCNSYEPQGLAVGDLNSDGHPDLAIADWWNGLVVLLHTSAPADTVPPSVAVEPLIDTIWPPTGATVQLPVNVTATDADSGVSNLHLAVIDEYGLVQPEMDVAPGTTVMVPLVASRNENDLDGRVYTLVLTGTDVAGNIAVAEAAVTVPHSNPKKPKKVK